MRPGDEDEPAALCPATEKPHRLLLEPAGWGPFAPREAGWAGYGDSRVPPGVPVAVLRSGYGDGFPKNLADGVDILSVGMQYTARVMHEGVDVRVLIGGGDGADTLARRSGISSQELVTGLAPR